MRARTSRAVDDLERAARREAEPQLGRAEERAVRGERDLVAGARVVEARGDVDDEAHLPAHGEYPADHAVAVRRLAAARRGHEVLHLTHSVGHQEARDEDVGVGEVELLGAPAVAVGRDAEQAPAVGVEDRREDARRVEARAAVPVDRPVGADERDGVQVADQAVLGDGQVARPRPTARPALDDACAISDSCRLTARARAFPSPPSSRAARARDARRTAAGARPRPGGSCPARSSSSSARKSSRNHSGSRGPPPTGSGRRAPHGKHLVAFAQLLDPVAGHPPAGREQAPERDGRGRRVPLDPPSPALVPVRRSWRSGRNTTSRPPGRSARKERSDSAPPSPSSTTSTPLPGSSRTRARKSSLR